jgi:cytochrome c biogenesis protein CcdA
MYDYQSQPTEPFRVTPGFVAFISLCFLPVVLALAIYLGAWAVSSEVYAAEAAVEEQRSGFNTVDAANPDVAGWKRTLVSVCPLH